MGPSLQEQQEEQAAALRQQAAAAQRDQEEAEEAEEGGERRREKEKWQVRRWATGLHQIRQSNLHAVSCCHALRRCLLHNLGRKAWRV